MKKLTTNISLVLMMAVVIFITSCSETDPLPLSVAGFDVSNKNKLEKYVPVDFINQSINTATFKWDFGDGTFDSLNFSPQHTYDEEGSYDVTLTAITEDGQTSMETQSVDIKTRVLVAFSVTNISFVNENGEPWDDDGTGPDLIFIFGAQSADIEDIIITDTTKNLTPADFPLDWEFSQGSGLELNSELYDLVLLDADPEKPEGEDPFDVMFGIEFDPVLYEFAVKDENDNGLIQVSIGGFAIDLFVTFALQ